VIYGVDVSSWQPEAFPLEIDGVAVDFAIIKVSEGDLYINPKWQAQRDHARRNGLSVGYYHFARQGNLLFQAERFLAIAQPATGEHLWLDWEDTQVTCYEKDEWIRHLKGNAPQHRVGLYCNQDFWLNRDVSNFVGDGLWIAHHGTPAGMPDTDDSPWAIHQYSTGGGIDHNVAQSASRQEMKDWASGLITAPKDPLDVIADGVLINRQMIESLAHELEMERQVSRARYDTLKESVDQIRVTVDGLVPDHGDPAADVVDELARRLTS
jgi:GH25 family lysozyme M1 (1,4-beta-N-acetylmuramidase)